MSTPVVPEIDTGAVGQARRALFSKLAPLLDEGRVQPYPDSVPSAPSIVIGSPRLSTRSVGNPAATVTVATFPVVIRFDGAKREALKQLDGLIAKVWRIGGDLGRLSRSIASSPSTSDAVGSGTPTIQTQTIDIEIGVEPIAWCPPAPEQEQP